MTHSENMKRRKTLINQQHKTLNNYDNMHLLHTMCNVHQCRAMQCKVIGSKTDWKNSMKSVHNEILIVCILIIGSCLMKCLPQVLHSIYGNVHGTMFLFVTVFNKCFTYPIFSFFFVLPLGFYFQLLLIFYLLHQLRFSIKTNSKRLCNNMV